MERVTMIKIFVSYTTMSDEITFEVLKAIKNKLLFFSYPYIELLDPGEIKSQESVIIQLITSDLLLLLETKYTNQSKWVNLELNCAKVNGIPVVSISPNSI